MEEHCYNIPISKKPAWRWLLEISRVNGNIFEGGLSGLCCREAAVKPVIINSKMDVETPIMVSYILLFCRRDVVIKSNFINFC